MTAHDWLDLEAVFSEARAIPPHERTAWLRSRCADRPHLVAEVEALLEASHRAGDFLGSDRDSLPLDDDDAVAPPASAVGPGTLIGAYQLIEKVGEGGMGEVYRAARADGAFDLEVAVKMMRVSFAHDEAWTRFARERRILASLDHRHIVRLLDGGVTATGVAYLVMEYIQGLPITSYCAQHRLSLDDRLKLIEQICEAVGHAHQHAVVHRDLKPANVLVTRTGIPKVLDFGVAKLVAEQQDAASLEQTIGLFPAPMTVNYASPEQLRGLAVTTSTDVYALGVLLYEIVCGQRPYETQGAPLDQVIDLVARSEPQRPSVRLDAQADAALPYGAASLRGDIDAIVMKAIAKDPADRYRSVGDLAADLDRHRHRRPVLARPPSAAYLFRRFARRNRVLVGAFSAAVLAIVVALGVALWQWRAARDSERLAQRRFEQTRALANKVLVDYSGQLRAIRGTVNLQSRMTADSLAYLDALSSERLDEDVLMDVAVGYMSIAEVQGSISEANLGDPAGAMRSLDKADQLLQAMAGTRRDDPRLQDLFARLECTRATADRRRTLEHARACVASTEALSRRDPADRTLLLRLADAHLAAAEAGDLSHGPQAVATYQRLADDEANGQRARVQMARALRGIGLDALNRNELAAAREAGQRAIALLAPIFKATPEQVRTDYALSLSLLGRSFAAQGDTAQAIPLFAEALTTIRDAYDADPNNAILQDRLPIIYELLARATERQDRAAGARLFREAIELLPSLTLEVATRGRDRVRGLLYTGYARTNFRVPPCAVLDQADVHFDAMRQAGIPIDPITAAAAQWVSNARARCES